MVIRNRGRQKGVSLVESREKREMAYNMYFKEKMTQPEIARALKCTQPNVVGMIEREKRERKNYQKETK